VNLWHFADNFGALDYNSPYLVGGLGGVPAYFGLRTTATPEAAIVGGVGSTCINTAGAGGTILYVKQSGTGNTGWGAVPTFLIGSATIDPGNLADGAGETDTITVTGAALGDFVQIAAPYDLLGITVTGWVSGADTVSLRIQNESGGALDLASGTWRARVAKL
jgi:hypothetical protein